MTMGLFEIIVYLGHAPYSLHVSHVTERATKSLFRGRLGLVSWLAS